MTFGHQCSSQNLAGTTAAEHHDAVCLARGQTQLVHDIGTGSGLADHPNIVTGLQLMVLARHNRLAIAGDGADNKIPIGTVASADVAQSLPDERS